MENQRQPLLLLESNNIELDTKDLLKDYTQLIWGNYPFTEEKEETLFLERNITMTEWEMPNKKKIHCPT